MSIGESLKRFRGEFNLTQKQVANAAGVVPEAYQKYEYGKNVPLATVLIRLADTYDVSIDYLVGRSNNPARLP